MTPVDFLLLDAARMHGDLHQARALNPDHSCLYEGDSERFLSAVAPWLFSVPPGSPFVQWVVENGTGQSWGVLLRCEPDPVKLYKHLRNYLIVQGDDGKEMYFRYYDPRVLRVFLPTCEPDQLRTFFGPIEAMVAEDPEGQVIEYRLGANNELLILATGRNLGEYLSGTEQKQVEGDVQEPGPVPRQNDAWDFGY